MLRNPERITPPLLDVLEALLTSPNTEMHGWVLMKATRRLGPTVYNVLERLEDLGWVTTRWDDTTEPGRPRRRYYRLTTEAADHSRTLLASRGRPQANQP